MVTRSGTRNHCGLDHGVMTPVALTIFEIVTRDGNGWQTGVFGVQADGTWLPATRSVRMVTLPPSRQSVIGNRLESGTGARTQSASRSCDVF
jgi:hypothetical protein